MEWSGTTWIVSVIAVAISGATAWLEGNWKRRPGLTLGFANHGGMWGDLVLLPVANALVVPYLRGWLWIAGSVIVAAVVSAWLHVHWYRGHDAARGHQAHGQGGHSTGHMWPARPHGSWWRDLSWAGWLHVIYVTGELALLAGFLVHPLPRQTVVAVAALLSVHVPIGLLQPRWCVTRRLASLREQPLLVPSLAILWIVAAAKM